MICYSFMVIIKVNSVKYTNNQNIFLWPQILVNNMHTNKYYLLGISINEMKC